MNESHVEKENLIPLIYEAAEDVELWPKLLSACKQELLDSGHTEIGDDEKLLSHLQRALRMNHRMEQISHDMDSAQKLLNYLPMAVITITQDLKVLTKNRLAENLLASSQIFNIVNERLHTSDLTVSQKLKKIVKNAVKENSQGCSLKIDNPQGAMSIFALSSSETNESQNTFCTLFFASNAWSQHVSAGALQEYYNLTAAEARLALMLASGQSLTEISTTLNLSQNTVRNQLKSVFAKTETSRQAELVALIMSTPTGFTAKQPTAGNGNSDIIIQAKKTPLMKAIVLRDGRHLNYKLYGDPEGIPVVYHHDVVAWDWWSLVDPSALFVNKGIRFIHPFRPGYYGTDLHEKTNMKMWAEDMEELLNYLDIDEFYALGFSSGAMFAAASAYYLSERCNKLSLVSSMAPIENMGELEGSKPAMSRLLLGFARVAPRLYRKFFNSLLRTIGRNSSDYLRNYISNWSKADQIFTDNRAFLDSINRSFQDAIKSKSPGIVYECIFAVRDWGFQPEDIQIPTDIWRGENDNAIAKKLADKLLNIPNHTYNLQTNSGHLLIVDFAEIILESLIADSKPLHNPFITGEKLKVI